MHRVVRREDVQLEPAYVAQSAGFARCGLLKGEAAAVHMGVGLCTIEPDGWIATHVHSFEESFFVLDGMPVLALDGRRYQLGRGMCGVVPLGVPHSWLGTPHGPGRWIEMAAPKPRQEGAAADTFFVDSEPELESSEVDVRDPRSRHLFRMVGGEMTLEELKLGSPIDAPTISASMNTALLVYSGIAVKSIVDQRLDAQLSAMLMVEYQPGGVAHPHDHPLEESYYVLEGEVDAVADGARYTLSPGDFLWTSVGCIHAFYNTSGKTVRWLETQAPQPPAQHAYRFNRDWSYLEQKLGLAAERDALRASSSDGRRP